jgi:hypothetical protein
VGEEARAVRSFPPPWFDDSIVQILGRESVTVGVGVVIDDARVLTCGHVVTSALAMPGSAGRSPPRLALGARLVVRRPWVHQESEIVMTVEAFTEAVGPDGTHDLALLVRAHGRFAFPNGPPRFIDSQRVPLQPVLLRGFPQDIRDPGLAATAEYRLVDRNPNGWFSIVAADAHGNEVRGGFSGGPAWGGESAGIVGIVSVADVERRTSALVPSAVLRRFVPEMKLSSANADVQIQGAHPLRRWLDRRLPKVHQLMVDGGFLQEPPDRATLLQYLERTAASAHHAIESKRRFIALAALDPRGTVPAPPLRDPVLSPLQQVIREIVGTSGGDGMTAEISAFTRRSRRIRNIVRRLLSARTPLVLLGEPGSGKSLTLQYTLRAIADQELRRQYPTACLLLRMGEFHSSGPVQAEDIWEYVSSRPETAEIWHLIPRLAETGRLLVMFDGLDEMSREGYSESLAGLSTFAQQLHQGKRRIPTLFSCRVADFSPAFQHRRLLLLPFNRSQVRAYLREQDTLFPLRIDGIDWSPDSLATYLVQAELPVQATNPFILWMLCQYLRSHGRWPQSRVQLLEHTAVATYEAKYGTVSDRLRAADFAAWARLALEITLRNQGSAIALKEAVSVCGSAEAVARGKHCGILIESRDQIGGSAGVMLRFDHHRWQEYFAAVELARGTDAPNPIPLNPQAFDSPRLQETLINVALLDGRNDLFAQLDAFVQEQVDLFALLEPGEKLPYDEEAVFADRIEFVGRLIAESSRDHVGVVSQTLSSAFEAATRSLAALGRATSQVKVLSAAWKARAPYLDEVVEQVFQSETGWARGHAVAVASYPGGLQSPERSLETEMTRSLAAGTFLHGVAEFPRIGRISKARGVWPLTILGSLLSFASIAAFVAILLVLRGVVVGLCESMGATDPEVAETVDSGRLVQAVDSVLARSMGATDSEVAEMFDSGRLVQAVDSMLASAPPEQAEPLKDLRNEALAVQALYRISVSLFRTYNDRSWWMMAGGALFVAIVAGLMLGFAEGRESRAWSFALYAGLVMLVGPVLLHGWRDIPPMSVRDIAVLVFFAWGLVWIIEEIAEIIVFGVDAATTATFAGVARLSSGRPVALRSSLRMMRERRDLGLARETWRFARGAVRVGLWATKAMLWALGILLCLFIILAVVGLAFGGGAEEAPTGAVIAGVVLFALAAIVLFLVVRRLLRAMWKTRVKLRELASGIFYLVGGLFYVGIVLWIVNAAAGAVLGWIGDGAGIDVETVWNQPNPSGVRLLSVLLVVGLLAIGALFLSIGWRAAKHLGRVVRLRRLPPTMSLAQWQDQLRVAGDMEEVARIIHWSSPQKLGITREQFLTALVAVEPLAARDPALAAWNERVNEMEGAIRQERISGVHEPADPTKA